MKTLKNVPLRNSLFLRQINLINTWIEWKTINKTEKIWKIVCARETETAKISFRPPLMVGCENKNQNLIANSIKLGKQYVWSYIVGDVRAGSRVLEKPWRRQSNIKCPTLNGNRTCLWKSENSHEMCLNGFDWSILRQSKAGWARKKDIEAWEGRELRGVPIRIKKSLRIDPNKVLIQGEKLEKRQNGFKLTFSSYFSSF